MCAASLALSIALTACFGNAMTVFPPGVAPLEDDTAPPPPPDASGHLPETITFRGGQRGSVYWIHAFAYVRAPVAAVWAAMKDPEVVIDRRQVSEYTWDVGVEKGYDVSFVVHDVVHSIITVNFDLTWRESAVEGTPQEPSVVAMQFQKTNGTTTITTLHASIVLREASEAGVSELLMVEYLDALRGGADTIESQMRDLVASVIARVNGLPLPKY